MSAVGHVLVLFDSSTRGRRALRAAERLAVIAGARLTVVTVALLEVRRGCCDLRADIWNRLQREAAAGDLQVAKETLRAIECVNFVAAASSRLEDALTAETLASDCDVVVVPDPRRSMLPRRGALSAAVRDRSQRRVLTASEAAAFTA